jgi:arylsulfatase A-like enzyme
VLLVAAWLGLLTGFGELALLGIRRYLLHRFLFIGQDTVWALPVADAVLFLVFAVLFLILHRIAPTRIRLVHLVGFLVAVGCFALFLHYGPLHRVAALILAVGAGVQVARMWNRGSPRALGLIRRTTPLLLGLVVLGAGLLTGSHWWQRRQAAAMSPPSGKATVNVLLIVLDTVRAWSMSAYGYSRATTPALARWAEGGVRFSRAFSAAPWTLPSHASMFTGLWPHQLSADWLVPLDGKTPVLAEYFRGRGYLTAGFVANTLYCSYETGLGRGFQQYQDYRVTPGTVMLSSSLAKFFMDDRDLWHRLKRKDAAQVDRDFLQWLDRRPQGVPFFAFLNYFDAHDPYQPPAPYDTWFDSTGRAEYLRAVRAATPARQWPAGAVTGARNGYDGALAYLDAQLSSLFDALAKRDLARNTLVVVVSDHGEEFGEHGVYFHGNSLYRASIQVPLMIVLPGKVPVGQVVEHPVSLRDLAATIVSLTTPDEPSPFPGRSLERYWGPERTGQPSDSLLSELNYTARLPANTPISRGPMKSLILDGSRLIKNGDGVNELYDFESDTLEARNLATDSASAVTVVKLNQALGALLKPATSAASNGSHGPEARGGHP